MFPLPDDFHKGSHEHFSDKSRVLSYNLLRRARQLYLSPNNDPESRDTDVLNQQMYIDGGKNLSLLLYSSTPGLA